MNFVSLESQCFIVFAMLPAHGIWRETVSLLDFMWPWTSQWLGVLWREKRQLYNNACYVGETTRHFSTRMREHLVSDFQTPTEFWTLSRFVFSRRFHILDHASTSFQLKIKEAFHIQREQSSLNQQLHHVNIVTFYVHSVVISIFPSHKFNF